jgi:hypothetical protein
MIDLPTLTHARDADEACIETPDGVVCLDLAAYRRRVEAYEARSRKLAALLAAGLLTVELWRQAMRYELRTLHAVAYVVGVGGMSGVTTANAALLTAAVEAQYGFLDGFIADMTAGALSEAQIASRAALYGTASNATLQSAAGSAMGMPRLPAYPGDGTSICRVNCLCHWRIEYLGGADWNAYWRKAPAESCKTCLNRAIVWNPLHIRGGEVMPYSVFDLFVSLITA